MQRGDVSCAKRARVLSRNEIQEIVMDSDSDKDKYHATQESEDEEEPRPPSRWSFLLQLHIPFYGQTLARARYCHILHFLHFTDNNRNGVDRTDDRLWKIRDLFEIIRMNFSKFYNPSEHPEKMQMFRHQNVQTMRLYWIHI